MLSETLSRKQAGGRILELARSGRAETIGIAVASSAWQKRGPALRGIGGQTLPALGLIPVSTVLAPENADSGHGKHLESGRRSTDTNPSRCDEW